MGIDTNKGSTWLEYPMCLGESLCYHHFKTLPCVLFAFIMAIHSHYCFLFLWCKRSAKMFRVKETNAALEPYIEKITQISIRDIVIVRRISNNCIEYPTLKWKLTSRCAIYDSSLPTVHQTLYCFKNPC